MRKYIVFILLIATVLTASAGCFSGQDVITYNQIGDYTGQNYETAVKSMQDAYAINTIYIYSSEAGKGEIIYQNPCPEKELKTQDAVTFYISRGHPPEGLDVEGLSLSEAEQKLQGLSYACEYADNAYVDQDTAFGLSENSGEYILYVSNGRPAWPVSGQPGYAVKAGGYIFYTDNDNIYKMNPDGTDNKQLVDINSIKEIIPYEDWIIYGDMEDSIKSGYNFKTEKEIYAADNAYNIAGVVDGQIIYCTSQGLIKKSIESGKEYVIEKGELKNVMIADDHYIFEKSYTTAEGEYRSDLVTIDIFTGERREIAKAVSNMKRVFFDDGAIYYSDQDSLYAVRADGTGNKERYNSVGDVYMVFDNHAVYHNNGSDYTEIMDLASGQTDILCNEGSLFGLDRKSGWYYFYEDGATHRMKSDESSREYFCKDVLSPGQYIDAIFLNTDGLVFIDNWIYYFNEDGILSRYNTDTAQTEPVADQPTLLYDWSKI